MTDRQLEWFVANTVMGVKVRPTSGIGSNTFGDWGYTYSRDTIAQAENEIGKMGERVRIEYADALLGDGGLFDLILATPKQRCQAMYQIREHIAQARKDNHD